ncbi:MAG TPA: carboxypeptidase regulatory-like domain-containing protein [Acidobacteriaceae bacterium]|nr:carboxypeptidase regulatory-like domain-containing protein [Acidobacteriaceae bacterium]
MLRRFWALTGLLLFAASAALAQTSGTIVGSVRDASGAAISGATITVTSVERGTSQTTTSGDDGNYVVPFLPAGSYTVTAEKQGFEKQSSAATQVDVDQRARLDFALSVGNVSQTVQVTSAAPLVRTESAELGEVINERKVQDLPLNGRNFAQLVYLVPGVTPGQQGENLSGASTFNPRAGSDFNALGAQESSSAWLVDGIVDNEVTFNTVMVQPSVESIQEFKVLTGTYSAEYGRGSGVVTTQTRSGTNQLHGEAFEFVRTDQFDARSYFNTLNQTKPGYHRNQFGAALGGPIWKDKTFFFMDYYGETQTQGGTFLSTVPTALDRTGNFSDQNFTIYNPYSTTVNSNGQTVRTAFQNNVIPQNLINPIGSRIANLYPLPNIPGKLTNNYIDTLNSILGDNGGNVRIDHKISDKDTVFGRYSYERFTLFATKGQGGCCIRTPAAYQSLYDLGPYISGGQNTTLLASGLALNETHVFTPSLVNEFIAGYNHTNPLTVQSDYGHQGATKLGIAGINVNQATSGIPTINIGGAGGGLSYTAINDGPSFLPANPRQTSYQLEDSLSWTKGPHSIKFGYRIVKDVYSPFSNSTTRGQLNFQLNLTNNPLDAQGGSGLASLLMGLMANGNSAGANRGFYLAPPYLTSYEHGAYVQDDWKASRRLTVNLGLRWDLFTPATEKNNGMTNFDMTNLRLIYAGENGTSRAVNLQTRYRNFGPRIGFAYDVKGDGTTVVRGGYAISYFPQLAAASGVLTENVPQTVSQNTATLPLYPTNLSAVPSLAQPFPAPVPSHPITTADLIAANPSIVGDQYANQTPSFQSYNLDVERQFSSDWLLELAYAGSRSVHLLFCVNPQEVQPGPASVPSGNRITIPAISSVRNIFECSNTNFSNYNGLNVKVTKRLSHGLSLLTSYSWSKSLDDGGSPANGGGYVGNPQTITNLRGGYGPSGFNIPQRFVESWTWNLPFGKGRAFLNDNNILSAIFGGWETDGIATVQSGYPFTVGNMTACANNASNCWPDLVSKTTKPANQTYAHWYDPAAFAVPCAIANNANGSCSSPAYQYGNVGRGFMRGPQTVNFDLSVARNFQVKERFTIQTRVDAFDALNHPPMGIPNQTINTNNPAGTNTAITSTTGDNRDLQGSLKFTF